MLMLLELFILFVSLYVIATLGCCMICVHCPTIVFSERFFTNNAEPIENDDDDNIDTDANDQTAAECSRGRKMYKSNLTGIDKIIRAGFWPSSKAGQGQHYRILPEVHNYKYKPLI